MTTQTRVITDGIVTVFILGRRLNVEYLCNCVCMGTVGYRNVIHNSKTRKKSNCSLPPLKICCIALVIIITRCSGTPTTSS